MAKAATIRHRELQLQSRELRQLAAKLHASRKCSDEQREAKRAIKEFGRKLGGLRMSEVYDVVYSRYGPHAVRGVSDAWTLVHDWNA